MAIPESQLDIWSKQGSIAQSSETYATIKRVLEHPDAPYAGRDYTIFLQGSYGNATNIYADSDVDVVIQLNTAFHYDLSLLDTTQVDLFKRTFNNAEYGYTHFTADVIGWLKNCFGGDANPGTKAIFIAEGGGRRNADVIVSCQYRKYFSFTGARDNNYAQGICFFSSEGTKIANFPKQHSENCTAKHQSTNQWFKPTVRIFKNMRNRLIGNGTIEDGLAPSYYLEGLLYNVPNDQFGQSYAETFANAVDWLLATDRSKLLCANQQYYLLHADSPVTWRAEKYAEFLVAANQLWNDW